LDGNWKSTKDQIISGKIALKRIQDCLINKTSFNWETTLISNLTLLKIKQAKKLGFTVNLNFIGVGDVEQSIQRIKERVKKVCLNVCKLDENALSLLKKIQLRPIDEIRSAAEILKAIANYITINQFIAKKANYFMLDLYDYIDKHIHEKITVDDICKNLYLSKTKLYSLVSKELPNGLNNYIIHKKLSIAVKLLYSTNKNLCQIAKEVGIDNANYLCKLFKKYYNVTPAEYRKKFTKNTATYNI
jgi:YesN/AraC family two-component response regulator